MKLAIAGTQLAASQTVSLENSRRYLSIMDSYGFKPITYWTGRGIIPDNIFGEGSKGEGFSASCIPCDISFTGTSSKVTVTTRVYASSSKNHVFRWGICAYDLDWLFQSFGAVDNSDGNILGQGKFSVDPGSVHYQTFTFPVQNLPSGKFYIYLWRDNTSYGNVHVSGNFDVKVYTETSAVSWKNATPYIFDGTQWKPAVAFIRNRYKEWVRAQ